MDKNNFDVTIVGYGPVGKALALQLAQKGWKVGIFEKFPQSYPLPRAVVFDDEIARVLQSITDMDEIMKISKSVPDFYEWRNAARQTLLKIDWSQQGISGWPGHNFFSQPDLEAVLNKECVKNPLIEVNMGHKAIDLKENNDYVDLYIETQEGSKKLVRSQYVIGCDGANSFVRDYMKTEVKDLGFAFDWLILDIIPGDEREWRPMNWQLCDPERPTTIVSGGPGRRRFEFMRLPNESIEEMKKESFAWEMLKKWDLHPQNCTLERNAVYTFRGQWAESWNKGRLLLAGDSAHLMPPFLGQGMCSGLRDAQNLAWKLDLVLNNTFTEEILDTYTEERKEHVKSIIDMSIFLGEIICITDTQKAKKRDEDFLTGNAPEFPPFPHLEKGIIDKTFSDLGGTLSLQGVVEYKGKKGLFDDVVGRGWTIITIGEGVLKTLSEESIEIFEEMGVKIVQITSHSSASANSVIDIDGRYLDFFTKNKIESLIVRPDFYIFGAATNREQLSQLISIVNGKLQKSKVNV